ncbi:MAG: hypothetical protein ACPF9D_08835, partial [Owenweeksia sp.]
MKKVVLNSFIIASMAAITVACEDENLLGSDGADELRLGEYYLEAESIVSYLYNITDKAYNDSTFNASDSTMIWGIPVVATSTATMELRFGNGITGNDGITRKGKVMVNETGDFTATGGSLNLSFDNFRVDNRVIGNSTTSMSISNAAAGSFNIGIANLDINSEFVYSGTKSITWTSGFGTPTETDDVYNVSGNFDGSETETSNGISGNMVEPLIYDRTCNYGVISGLVDLTLSGDSLAASSGSVDFLKDDGCANASRHLHTCSSMIQTFETGHMSPTLFLEG